MMVNACKTDQPCIEAGNFHSGEGTDEGHPSRQARVLLLLPVLVHLPTALYSAVHVHEAEWDHAMIMRFGDRHILMEG